MDVIKTEDKFGDIIDGEISNEVTEVIANGASTDLLIEIISTIHLRMKHCGCLLNIDPQRRLW